jgi:general secretion pathway protein A
MDYFTILNLSREPFSNSPDPDYFYHSRQHLDCLQKLELSLHLRRGLNVIIGEVGTGKTTLCRQLIRRFAQRKEIETHLILDPSFRDGGDFLGTVAKLLSGRKPPEGTSEWQVKEFIKQHLFRKGVDQKKTTMLIIDEGQKLPLFCLELLREFLNYETNEYKLLQIVIFAQKEFEAVVGRHPNFADRINLYHHLQPLSFRDTRMMIQFRLEKSSNGAQPLDLFTLPALVAVYRATGGYPRKIINLCHQCILAMIIQNRKKVGWRIVRQCAGRVFTAEGGRRRLLPAASMTAAALAALLAWAWWQGRIPQLPWNEPRPLAAAAVGEPATPAPIPKADRAAAVVEPSVPPPEGDAPAPPAPAAAAPAEPPPEPPAVAAAAAEASPAPAPPAPSVAAAAAPAGGDPPAIKTAPLQAPGSLGSVSLKRNETISGLIQRVYGDYSNKNFRSIILANPHIEDPDRVEVGQTILLPAIPVSINPLKREAWWVKITERASLQEAFDLVRNYPSTAAPARLIPYWAPGVGLRFSVILKQVFSDPDTARLQLDLLPRSLSSTGEVLSAWTPGAVFYADPYYMNR